MTDGINITTLEKSVTAWAARLTKKGHEVNVHVSRSGHDRDYMYSTGTTSYVELTVDDVSVVFRAYGYAPGRSNEFGGLFVINVLGLCCKGKAIGQPILIQTCTISALGKIAQY